MSIVRNIRGGSSRRVLGYSFGGLRGSFYPEFTDLYGFKPKKQPVKKQPVKKQPPSTTKKILKRKYVPVEEEEEEEEEQEEQEEEQEEQEEKYEEIEEEEPSSPVSSKVSKKQNPKPKKPVQQVKKVIPPKKKKQRTIFDD